MPQNAMAATVAKNQSNQQSTMLLDATQGLVTNGSGTLNKLAISTATVVKAAAGRVGSVIVTTAGSTAGSVSDVATTGGVASGNLVFSIPNTVGVYKLDFPCTTGITITPGTSQVISVSYI